MKNYTRDTSTRDSDSGSIVDSFSISYSFSYTSSQLALCWPQHGCVGSAKKQHVAKGHDAETPGGFFWSTGTRPMRWTFTSLIQSDQSYRWLAVFCCDTRWWLAFRLELPVRRFFYSHRFFCQKKVETTLERGKHIFFLQKKLRGRLFATNQWHDCRGRFCYTFWQVIGLPDMTGFDTDAIPSVRRSGEREVLRWTPWIWPKTKVFPANFPFNQHLEFMIE